MRKKRIIEKLCFYSTLQSCLPRIIICPVADNLKAMREVAVRVRKVRLQLQRGPVALDGLRNVTAVLVHARQVRVRVRKGRIDLDGSE